MQTAAGSDVALAQPAVDAPAPQQVLEFRDVSKRFDDGTLALDGVSLGVRQGEFVSIVGPSGCGKSTLLRLSSGLSPITGGEIETRFSSLGYVFQDATLLPWRTVERNVELLGELDGVPRSLRRRAAAEAIQLVGLAGFEKSYPRALSGGMRMRTSLARALTRNPDPFFFDEPFGALDAITRERLNDEVQNLYTQRRFTAVFVTHALSEAIYLATRVVVMSARPGRVVAEFDIPFDYPRGPDLRFTNEFSDLSQQIAHALLEGSR